MKLACWDIDRGHPFVPRQEHRKGIVHPAEYIAPYCPRNTVVSDPPAPRRKATQQSPLARCDFDFFTSLAKTVHPGNLF